MADFQRFRIDLNGAVDPSIAKKLVDPPGFSSAVAKESAEPALSTRKSQAVSIHKRQEALMAMAMSPAKQAGMMAFMMYMAGTHLHFFSIMATVNGIYSPLNAILKSGAVFVQDQEKQLNVTLPRLVFCAIHGAALAFAVYRIHLMGLLPTHLSDWVAAIQAPEVRERAVGGMLRPFG